MNFKKNADGFAAFGGVSRVLNAHLPDLEGYVTDLTGSAFDWQSKGRGFESHMLQSQNPRELSEGSRGFFVYYKDKFINSWYNIYTISYEEKREGG